MHWTIHLEGGPRRVNHAAVAIGQHIFSFGGYCSGEVQCRNEPIDVHMLNTSESYLYFKRKTFARWFYTILSLWDEKNWKWPKDEEILDHSCNRILSILRDFDF